MQSYLLTLKMSSYKLIYFNFTGLGEPIRYLLHQSGIEFENKILNVEEWPKIKSTMPLGQVPVLEIDGKPYVQSKAIGRLIAKRNNLYGANDVEEYEIDATIDFVADLSVLMARWQWEKNPEVKQKLKQEIDVKLPFTLQKLDEQVKKNGGFLVGGKLTWADLQIAAHLETLNNQLKTEVTEDFPDLKKLKEKVRSLPKIKAYLDSRPKMLF
ncbi:glutathione S-transferase-like isoform X2 [Ceratina calcarata]|uniref:glutathione transferase n=1 Tax=Ceratina calcarata TaxID=156304 RepID=A0AAJ7NC11_9HYME|nr:glutathione S-transferase-like isoform X2 [Ceratina calcarata]